MKKLLLIASSFILLLCSTASEVKALWGRYGYYGRPYRYGYGYRPWRYRSYGYGYRPWRSYYGGYGYGYPYGYYGWGRPAVGFSIGF